MKVGFSQAHEKTTILPNEICEMLSEHNINVDIYGHLSETQKKAFELFKNGKNLLLMGAAGMGKSFCIKIFKEYNESVLKKSMYITSTTGISAYSIGGVTIHSLLGVGTGDLDIDLLIRKVSRSKMYKDRILNMDILIIDEASMLSCALFEKFNLLCQSIRKNKLFFGGIQIIFSMDPLQLLPVFNKNKDLYKDVNEHLIVESDIFNKYFNRNGKDNSNIIILNENFRQKNDPLFINLLDRIRNGIHTEDDMKVLNTRKIIPENVSDHIHLVVSNKKAQLINDTELKKLKTNSVTFQSNFTSIGKNKDTKELLIKELQFQFNQKGITDLVLKKGCRVMLIKNIDVNLGLVNGALGTVIDFNNNFPIVQFDNGVKQLINSLVWELEIDNCIGRAMQIPLMLAYSITCHKSQSLTLDSAILDLSDCFTDAMVYVALSRLRSLDGIYLKSFNPSKISVNKIMKDFLDNPNQQA